MIVYRYEKDGIGPYWSSSFSELDRLTTNHDDYRARKSDSQHVICRKWGCPKKDELLKRGLSAMKTKYQLKQWFKGYNSVLQREGFKIVKYEVQKGNFAEYKNQVVFLNY